MNFDPPQHPWDKPPDPPAHPEEKPYRSLFGDVNWDGKEDWKDDGLAYLMYDHYRRRQRQKAAADGQPAAGGETGWGGCAALLALGFAALMCYATLMGR